MKHEVTTYYTKKALAESLKNAMRHKPFSKITVSEIIADCGLNRKTFYYHFDDIYGLLKWMFAEETGSITQGFDLLVDTEEAITFVMDYVEKNDYIVSCASDPVGGEELKRFLTTNFMEIAHNIVDGAETLSGRKLDQAYKDFLCHFYVSAVANILTEWLLRRESWDREAIIRYLISTIHGSITGITQLNLALYPENLDAP